MISSVSTATSTLSIDPILQPTASSSSSAASTVPAATGDTASISGPGKLFSELKELATENPTKFKSVAADIAAKLKAAAGETSSTDGSGATTGSSATGGAASKLADLAAKFEQAAQTGDASGLQPPSGGHHRHHGGAHGASSTSGTGGYNSLGQPQPTSSTGTDGTDLKSLFDSISQEVTQALSA